MYEIRQSIHKYINNLSLYLYWFWIHWHNNSKILCHSVKQKSPHPQIISHNDPFTRPNLKFPLEILNFYQRAFYFTRKRLILEQAWFQHCFQLCPLQHKDNICNDSLQHLFHKPCWPQFHSNRDLEVLEIHF